MPAAAKKTNAVKLGIVGLGAMGTGHARSSLDGLVPRCELVAVCDSTGAAADATPHLHEAPSKIHNP